MKKSDFVLFFDSGTGGLSFLESAKNLLKNQNFVYVADFLNAPYGTKPKKILQNLILNTLKTYITKFSPKCVVLACNTATAVAVDCVRKNFDVKVIGTEPAILPALKQNFSHILVLCTPCTKKHSKLLKQHFKNSKLTFLCPKKLAQLVDQNFCNFDAVLPYVKRVLGKFKTRVDAVVLGCTHYVFLKNQIKNVLGDVTFFDSFDGVEKQLKKVLTSKHKNPKQIFVSTKADKQKMLENLGKVILS